MPKRKVPCTFKRKIPLDIQERIYQLQPQARDKGVLFVRSRPQSPDRLSAEIIREAAQEPDVVLLPAALLLQEWTGGNLLVPLQKVGP